MKKAIERVKAEKAYKRALARWEKAAAGKCLDSFLEADKELSAARTAKIDAEDRYPTPMEIRRKNELYRLRNRGLDV